MLERPHTGYGTLSMSAMVVLFWCSVALCCAHSAAAARARCDYPAAAQHAAEAAALRQEAEAAHAAAALKIEVTNNMDNPDGLVSNTWHWRQGFWRRRGGGVETHCPTALKVGFPSSNDCLRHASVARLQDGRNKASYVVYLRPQT